MAKLPWFKFFPTDWLGDVDLRNCSAQAKGVWIGMLAMMFQSRERGVLVRTDGSAMDDTFIAGVIGGNPDHVRAGIRELLAAGVVSRYDDGPWSGAYFSRRMVREESIRLAGVENGKKGWQKRQQNAQGLYPPSIDPPYTPPLQTPPIDHSGIWHMGSGSDSSGEEGMQGETGPPPPRFDEDIGGIGLGWASRIYDAYPVQEKREASLREIAKAAGVVRNRGSPNPPAWLLERVQAFAASPLGQSGKSGNRYCPSCERWMKDGRYDDDEKRWELREPDPAEARRKRDRNGEDLRL